MNTPRTQQNKTSSRVPLRAKRKRTTTRAFEIKVKVPSQLAYWLIRKPPKYTAKSKSRLQKIIARAMIRALKRFRTTNEQTIKLKSLNLPETLASAHMVPHAIVAQPVRALADLASSTVHQGQDDLDEYEGAAFSIDALPFVIMHYKGHPPDTSTIYLPMTVKDIDQITQCIDKIVTTFGLPKAALTWQRKDDPTL